MKQGKPWWKRAATRRTRSWSYWVLAVSVFLGWGPAGFGQTTTRAVAAKSAALIVPSTGKTGFTQLFPGQTGLDFTNQISRETLAAHQLVMNAGLAVGDVDGDGRPDIFFCRTDGKCVLYRNLGNWKFEDITERAGVACDGRKAMGAVFADVNGDGHLDLLVLALGGPNALFLNDGTGRFTEALDFPGRNSKVASVSAAFADIDGNGTLDLYIANYRVHSILDSMTAAEYRKLITTGLQQVQAGSVPSQEFLDWFTVETVVAGGRKSHNATERGVADVLYLNDGRGHFRDVTDEPGRWRDEAGKVIAMPDGWGLAAQFHDVNGDGAPDLYVCNDFLAPDRFWLNDGAGHFQLVAPLALRHASRFSMGVDFADFNRDGLVDFFTVDMLSRDHTRRKQQMGGMLPTPVAIGTFNNRPQIMQNTLFLNRGDGTYAEIAMLAGVKNSEWSWSPIFVDIDLDGYEDLLITTGMTRDYMDADTGDKLAARQGLSLKEEKQCRLLYPRLATANMIFRNRGDLTFEDVSEAWGFKQQAVSGGMVLADFDGDGDLDVIINNTWSAAEVYRNDGIAPRVAVRLKGRSPNTQGIGAKLKLLGGPVTQTQEVIAGGHYASGSDPLRVFAAGKATGGMTLEVTWRNGTR